MTAPPSPRQIAFGVLNSHSVTPNRHLVNRSRDTIADWIAEGIEKYKEQET